MSNKKELKKYFWEIMREFFSVWTPKFYKVNISNPKRILEELNNYINSTEESNYIQHEHIWYLIDEYLYRAKKDIIYKKYNTIYSEFHLFLRDKRENFSTLKQSDFLYFIDELKNRIQPIIRNLKHNYFNESKKQLLDIINKKDSEIKPWDYTLIKKICYSFSTEILRKWYSKYYIYDQIHEYVIWTNIDIEKFISLFNDINYNFEYYIKIITNNPDIKKIFSNKYWEGNVFCYDFPFHVNIDCNSTPWESHSFWRFFQKNSGIHNSFWLKIEAEWIDYRSVWNKITDNINIFLDEVKFEYITDNISIFHHILTRNIDGDVKFIINSDSLHIHRKSSSIEFFNKLNLKVKEINKSETITEATKEKIKTLFRFYRYFLESNTFEHRFLNLWIWWEHVFSLNFKKEAQTWKNINKFYPFIDSISLVEDILKDMIQVQLKRGENKNELDKLLSSDTKYIATNLYKIIKDKWKDWDRLLESDFLKDNDLIKVKLFRLHEKFKSPKVFVENYHNKIKWNFFRLYRVRNAIVHKWNIDSLGLPIEMLISDLELYYTNLFAIILSRFTTNDRFENIEQLFISIERTYQCFIKAEWISSLNEIEDVKKKIINLPLKF